MRHRVDAKHPQTVGQQDPIASANGVSTDATLENAQGTLRAHGHLGICGRPPMGS